MKELRDDRATGNHVPTPHRRTGPTLTRFILVAALALCRAGLGQTQTTFPLRLLTTGSGAITAAPALAQYAAGASVALTATPGRYYAFSQWSDGERNNPRTIVIGTDNVYEAIFTNTVPLEVHILREWDQSYGGPLFNHLNAIAPAPDGGYLLGGSSNSGIGQSKASTNYGDYDFWVVKVDAAGNQLWDADFGGSNTDNLNAVLPTPDGGYLLGGSSNSGPSGNKTTPNYGMADFWVVKLDGSGNEQWERDFGGSADDNLTVMAPTGDGGYLLGGTTQSGASGNKTTPPYGAEDFWVIKIDSQGNKQWEKAYPWAGIMNQLNTMLPTAGGDYLLGGAAYGLSLDYWLLGIDASGNQLLEKTYGGTADDILRSIAPTRDGGYLLGGESWSQVSGDKTAPNYGSDDFWLVKIAGDGTKTWDRSYGGEDYESLDAIQPWPDGRYLLCGSVSGMTSPMRVIEVDSDGNALAQASFGGIGNNFLATATRTSDGALLLAGSSMAQPGPGKTAPLRGVQDFWLVKAAVEETPVGAPVVTVNSLFNPLNSYTNSGSASVAMTTTLPGGRLFYTLDGSAPTTNALLYSGPFSLNHSATIQALAVGTNGSPVVAAEPVNFNILVTAPKVASVAGLAADQTIGLTFDELLGPNATNVANYHLNNGAVVTSAVLQSDRRSVQLFVSGGLTNGVQLSIKNLQDSDGHPIAPNTIVSVPLIALLSADVDRTNTVSRAFASAPGSLTVWTDGSGIGGAADSFNYLYAPRTGDFDLAARVPNFDADPLRSKAGLMARESLVPGSRELSALVTPASPKASGLALYRASTGGATTNWPDSFTAQGLPYPDVWVRLQRQGNTFSAYVGTNGLDWAPIGQLTPQPPYPATVLVGLATTYGVSGMQALASYDHFGDATNVPPTLPADSWDTLHFAIEGSYEASYDAVATGPDAVYVGGHFSSVHGMSASNVVEWANGNWSALGTGNANGMDGNVLALALAPDGSLYAGGSFTHAGGVYAPSLARWDGTNWSALGGPLGGLNPAVYAIAVADDGKVYIGGMFDSIGGVPANNIAEWDGANWHGLGDGITKAEDPGKALVKAIAVSGNDLYVGGGFDHAGGSPANAIARWDGQQWHALGAGVAYPGYQPGVMAIAVSGFNVFVGGAFSEAGGGPADGVARWDGQQWSALGSGPPGGVRELAILGGEIFAAGNFNQINGQNILGLAEWNGSAWSALGSGLSGDYPYASALGASGRDLFVLGQFIGAGGKPAASSALWVLSNAPPTVTVTAPVRNAFLPLVAGNSVTNFLLTVNTQDSDGQVARVDYFAGNNLLGSATNAPFDFTWTNVAQGEYQLSARATDDQGGIGASPAIDILVHTPITPPVLSWLFPTNGARFTEGDTVPLALSVSDPDKTLQEIDFITNGVGTLASFSQPPYRFNWTNVAPGDFDLTVSQQGYPGYPGFQETLPPAVLPPLLRVHINDRPTVAIIKPIDGAVSYTTNALDIDVDATDLDGTVTEVALFRDGQLIATAASAPYEFQLVNLPAGMDVYTAQAIDNNGAMATSAPVHVSEMSEPPSYYAPHIALISPATNAVLIGPTNVTLVAQISDLGYPIREVDFGMNNQDLGVVSSPPFSWTVTNLPPGGYTFQAIVDDAGGYSAQSPPLPVTIIPNPAITPALTLLTPTNGASVPVGAELPLVVSVVPHASTVDRIDFYVGNELVGSVTNPPYTLNWRPPVARPACWSVVATYDQTQTVSSAESCLNVFLPPEGHPKYVVVNIGPLATNASAAYGLNNLGDFVGFWQTRDGNVPFIDSGGVLTLLNQGPITTGAAQAINDSDQVAASDDQSGTAYIYQDGKFTNIGSLGGTPVLIESINDAGQAAGDSRLANGQTHGFLSDGQRLHDLGTLPGGSFSQANAINGAGVVAGWSQSASGDRAFIYDPQHGMQVIPGSLGGNGTYAQAINNLGAVVGNAVVNAAGTHHAFVYQNGAMQDLGAFGGQTASSYANGINDSNVVVGYCQPSSTEDNRAFLWKTNVMFDLNDLLPTNSQWHITAANAINALGQIVGTGRFGDTDRTEYAVLLNPMPTPGQSNPPPSITLVAPTNNTVLASGTSLTLWAAAAVQVGQLTQVDFYAGTRLLGAVTSPPYRYDWMNVPAGTYQVRAVAVDSSGSQATSASVSVVAQAPSPEAPRVAILAAATPAQNADVQYKLRQTLLLNGVDVIPVSASDPVPALSQLLPYDALLVYASQPFNAAPQLGDVLADYEDAGHGIVLALYAPDTSKNPLSGRLLSDDYLPWNETNDNFGSSLTLVKLLPNHPILDGVQSLAGGPYTYYEQNVTLAPGSLRIANWSNGQALIAARQVGRGRLVKLNFFPVSNDAGNSYSAWQANTDGARLLANALLWAAGPAPETLALNTLSNQLDYLPGQDVDLSVDVTNLTSAPAQVDLYTNNVLMTSLTNAPFSYKWLHPAIGKYLTLAVATDSQGNALVSEPLPINVDSRLTVQLLSPTNGTVVYYPTNLLLEATATDLDGAITDVDFVIDTNQFLARITHAPYVLNWKVEVVGTFTLEAVASDSLGARHITPPTTITVINYNPNAPIQTAWVGGDGPWQTATNWSKGIPRAQDTASIDDGGTAQLFSGLGAATNLAIGLDATGSVVQTGGSLTVEKSLMMAENSGSSAYYELDGGALSSYQLFLGAAGAGRFVQRGGTNVAKNNLSMSGNMGGQSLYELHGGEIDAVAEDISGMHAAEFDQDGGTNNVRSLLIGGSDPSVTGVYLLQAGCLNAFGESLDAQYFPATAILEQSGGTHRVTQELYIGDQGQGELFFSGGTLTAQELYIGSGGALDITAGGQTNGIVVTDLLRLDSQGSGPRLVVHLAPGYQPKVGDIWPLLTYGSLQGVFGRVTLPPATNGVTWQLEYETDQLVLRALQPPNLVVVGPISPASQTNLYYAIVEISNNGSQPLSGARVFLPNLPAGTEVYNASGTQNGIPYVEYDSPIAPGQAADFYVEFYTPQPMALASPNIVADLLTTNSVVNPPGTPLEIVQATRQPDGAFSLTFNSAPNTAYYIQYSSDFIHWQTVPQPVIGAGSRVEWLDDGPPKTTVAPQDQSFRFYRVVGSP